VRELADAERIATLLRELGREADAEGVAYLTGGATAVLYGWRSSTIDVDIKFSPERDELFRSVAALKDRLRLNVELASPADFIPVRRDWEERSPFITREGPLSFHHFDLCAQALAKIERNHEQDRKDVAAFLARGLVTREELAAYFDAIAPEIYRYPALDEPSFRRRVAETLANAAGR
jgi:hypothetical protein